MSEINKVNFLIRENKGFLGAKAFGPFWRGIKAIGGEDKLVSVELKVVDRPLENHDAQQPTQNFGMQTQRKRIYLTEAVKQSMRQEILKKLAYVSNSDINAVSLDKINTLSKNLRGILMSSLDKQTQNYWFKHLLPEISRNQQQQIQELQQQIKPSEIQQQIQMLEAMLGSTLQGHTFKDGAKHDAAEFAVRTGWIWNQSGHTYEKRLDQQTLASGADKLYNELRNHNSDWFIN